MDFPKAHPADQPSFVSQKAQVPERWVNGGVRREIGQKLTWGPFITGCIWHVYIFGDGKVALYFCKLANCYIKIVGKPKCKFKFKLAIA